MTTTYTVLDWNGTVIARHLTAREAMDEILTDDGHDYKILPAPDGGFELWVTRFSRNSTSGGEPLVKTDIWSLHNDKGKACDEIAIKVINSCWPRKPEAMTDDDYDAYMAEAEADHD